MVPKQVVPDRRGLVEIGKIKENLVTEVAFDCADLGDGSGAYAVVFQRPKDAAPYPVAFRAEWPTIVWIVHDADTAKPGTGKVEIRWFGAGAEVGKSKTYMVRINDGLPDPTEAPQEWAGYIGQVARNAETAQAAAAEAKTNADGAAASAGIAQGAAADAGKLARAAGDAANAAASAASAASSAQAGAGSAEQNARAAAEAAETARSGAESAKLAAGESATGAAGSAETAAQAAEKGENLYNQVKDDLASGKLKGEKGEKGDPGTDAPQIDDSVVSTENPWSSRQIIDRLCPKLDETGNPVTCYPVAGYPLGVVASWEPTQAGSGEPYPAGGGVNQWKWQKDVVFDTAVYPFQLAIADFPAELVGVPITVYADYKSDSTSGATSAVHFYKGASRVGICVLGAEATLTDVPTVAYFYAGTGDGSKGAYFKDIMLVKGNTKPTFYAPYENIRPISGREAVKVKRCGENLMQFSERIEDVYNQEIMRSDELLFLSKLYAGQKITLTFTVETKDIVFEELIEEEWRKRLGFECHGIAANGKEVWDLQCWMSNQSYNLSVNGKKIRTVTVVMPELVSGNIIFYAQNIQSGHYVAYDFGLYAGTTAPTAYTPYQGDTLDLQLPGTVYGGTVDAVTGDGTSEWGFLTLDGTENWMVSGKYLADKTDWYYVSPKIPGAVNETPLKGNEICSHYPHADIANKNALQGCAIVWGAIRVRWGDTIPDDADTWKAYLAAQAAAGTPVQVAYKLAQPVPFAATGAQPIPALAGCNTVLTDADTVTVTGRADPAHAITALQAQLAVATQQLAETEQAMLDTTAMAVDYIYQQDLEDIGVEEVDGSDNQTDTEPVDVPGV